MRLHSVLLAVVACIATGTPHMKVVLETNITTLVSVESRTSTERVVSKQDRGDNPPPGTDCSSKVAPLSCFLKTQSSVASASSSQSPEQSKSRTSSKSDIPSTTAAPSSDNATSTASTTSPTTTDNADRLRTCFLGPASKVTTCFNMFDGMTKVWKELSPNKPAYEQDYRFSTLFCGEELRNVREQMCVYLPRHCSYSNLIPFPLPSCTLSSPVQ
jgi:hypothetical protein